MKTMTLDRAERIGAQAHRPGGVWFHHLLAGDDDAPDNYSLTLVHVDEHYEAVRHRHNFEQVRVVLEGRFGFGAGQEQAAGSVGYFCEGTYYTQKAEGPSLTLLLQAGGASGSGYMGFARLQRGIAELKARGEGEFRDGVYTRTTADGRRVNQDGYEAVWEHVFGREITYPKPRYDAPVLLRPAHFAWLPWAGARGVAHKALGRFNERGLGVAMWQLEPGSRLALAGSGQRELLFVLRGEVRAGDTLLPRHGAFELAPDEGAELESGAEGAELIAFSLPRFR